ncbi:Cation/H+ exchanger [Schizophyllum amplum]|uniref:Cation/H+ exchanger n=1 Tax=Schizophyllum amplum TaxID=97359 RepID=A0A550CJY8_9AGAR|nr:Cation/H+ exchanger [Auriculariopsis ampla]
MPETVYEAPEIPTLLTLSSFLYLNSAASSLLERLVHANLLGPLFVGIIYGPQVANIIPADALSTFIDVGYIGLLIIVFEAGLTTDLSLLVANIALSTVTALTGIMFPIGFSFFLLYFGFEYTVLEATSLGTTLALLPARMRRTRVGAVLMSAALLDDVAGLVIAAIIVQLADNGAAGTVPWYVIVRPILVSLAFAGGVPALAYAVRAVVPASLLQRPAVCSGHAQLLLLVAVLSGIVAGANYAGTSELFGAYLAGIFLSILFETPELMSDNESATSASRTGAHPTHTAYEGYIAPVQNRLLGPLFFASVGGALPIQSLGRVEGSSAVVWKGIVFSILMVLCKAVVGVWMLIWPDAANGRGWFGARTSLPRSDRDEVQDEDTQTEKEARRSRLWSAGLLGVAMIPRGEIALIVAQLARPLLSPGDGDDSEAFAVVIWGILVTTVGGALGIGWMLSKRG